MKIVDLKVGTKIGTGNKYCETSIPPMCRERENKYTSNV